MLCADGGAKTFGDHEDGSRPPTSVVSPSSAGGPVFVSWRGCRPKRRRSRGAGWLEDGWRLADDVESSANDPFVSVPGDRATVSSITDDEPRATTREMP